MQRSRLELASAFLVGAGVTGVAWTVYQSLLQQNQSPQQPDYTPIPPLTSTPTFISPTEALNPTPTLVLPSPTVTPTPESNNNRLNQWRTFWPDTPEKAAEMFGGNASDWKMSDTWDGTKYNLVDSKGNPVKNYGLSGYKPIEWVPVNPEAPPYYWPKTPEEAAEYFFPGQKINPKFLSRNEYGGWHLSEDHWMFDGTAEKFLTLHPGEVAEGYYVGKDRLMKTQDDRVWVAFGGKKGQLGFIISAEGQGMTIWMPGTDPNKIALEAGNEYNTSTHYRGPSGDKLGPDPINFTPIYNAPGFDEIGFNTNSVAPGKLIAQIPVVALTEKLKVQLPLSAGTSPPRVTSVSQLGRREVSFRRNPFKGLRGNVYSYNRSSKA